MIDYRIAAAAAAAGATFIHVHGGGAPSQK